MADRSKKQAGYTIAEVLMVVAIAMALALAAAPGVGAILNLHRLDATARQLGFEITRARMEAVGQNVNVRITLVGSNQYKRERSSDSGATWSADGVTVSVPAGFALTAGETGTPRFDRQGLAPNSTSIIVFGPSGLRTVAINVLGAVTTS
jgi:Tfp pilus assembly protein FimT